VTQASTRLARLARRSGEVLAALLLLLVPVGQSAAQREPQPAGSGVRAEGSREQAATWSGWLQLGTAYTFGQPAHLSQARARAEIAGKGSLGDGVKWKLSARGTYDAAFDLTSFYPPGVRSDQRAEVVLREAYVDVGRGDWEFRLGRQHIVWGEMVGLFFADVVSAKDLRESILPEFEQIRIPQWAARAEWFAGDSHLEMVWLPWPETDRIGMPGAEFYSWPIRYEGLGFTIQDERRPARTLANGGAGARYSTLFDGWDMAVFAYRSPDSAPTFYRSLLDGPIPTVSYQAQHDRITRVGTTLAKDLDGIVAKSEWVYTSGRSFNIVAPAAGSGVVRQDTLDWVVGLDLTPAEGWRINGQLFQRVFLNFDRSIGLKRLETGASLLVAHELSPSLDYEALAIFSLVRGDWLLRSAITWKASNSSRVRAGVDLFGGDAYGLFGRFAARDRAYVDYRYNF